MGVSALIPNYNSGELLDRCLEALAAAHGIDEVLVLDGGSSDGSDERAAARPGVRVLAAPGSGLDERLNLGAREARSDLLLLLNSDAFVRPDTADLLTDALARDPQLGACGACLWYEDGSPQKSAGDYRTLPALVVNALSPRAVVGNARDGGDRYGPPKQIAGNVQRVGWLPLCCAVVRRSAFEAVGGFDERFSFYYDDHDFCRRIIDAGYGIGIRWDAGVVHVGGGSSRTRDPSGWFATYHENRFLYLRKHYPRAWPLYAIAWAARASVHVAAWRVRAWLRARRGDSEGAKAARAWAAAFSQTVSLYRDGSRP